MKTLMTVLLLTTALVSTVLAAEQRYYDRSRKDYHTWNTDEDQAYRVYLYNRNEPYRPFADRNERDRRGYFNWRHGHPGFGFHLELGR